MTVVGDTVDGSKPRFCVVHTSHVSERESLTVSTDKATLPH